MIATHSTAGKPDRTRPLCPYPQTAVYKGSGGIDNRVLLVIALGWWFDPHFGARSLIGLSIGTLIGGLWQLTAQFPSLRRAAAEKRGNIPLGDGIDVG